MCFSLRVLFAGKNVVENLADQSSINVSKGLPHINRLAKQHTCAIQEHTKKGWAYAEKKIPCTKQNKYSCAKNNFSNFPHITERTWRPIYPPKHLPHMIEIFTVAFFLFNCRSWATKLKKHWNVYRTNLFIQLKDTQSSFIKIRNLCKTTR